jgi:hypothetical protein
VKCKFYGNLLATQLTVISPLKITCILPLNLQWNNRKTSISPLIYSETTVKRGISRELRYNAGNLVDGEFTWIFYMLQMGEFIAGWRGGLVV